MAKRKKKLYKEASKGFWNSWGPMASDTRLEHRVQVTIWKGATRQIEDRWFEIIEALSPAEALEEATEIAEEYVSTLLPATNVYGISTQISPLNSERVDLNQCLQLPKLKPKVTPKGSTPPPLFVPFACPIMELCENVEILGKPRRSVRLD